MTETICIPTNQLKAEKFHTDMEIGNVYRCAKICKEWTSRPADWPSSQIIRHLHGILLENVPSYTKKGVIPLPPGCYRKDDIYVSGEPVNFYVRGLDVIPIMDEYCLELDKKLADLPSNPLCHVDEIIHQAAWAYYTFIRIHPFLDGNGRIGRMIMRRILSGGGFRDIIFYQQPGTAGKENEGFRNRHLDIMNRVDQTGNLAHLEVYIAELLLPRYKNGDINILSEIQSFITKKKHETNLQQQYNLAHIWPIFSDLDIFDGDTDSLSNSLE